VRVDQRQVVAELEVQLDDQQLARLPRTQPMHTAHHRCRAGERDDLLALRLR
jgi:hypothetical protein